MWVVVFTDEAAEERFALSATERNALLHAVDKLEAFGPQLGFPHTSAVQGYPDLRELRPRAGRRLTTGASAKQQAWHRPGWQN